MLIETLAEENANKEYKEDITPSKAWKVHRDEWIRDTTDIVSNVYYAHSIDQTVARGL